MELARMKKMGNPISSRQKLIVQVIICGGKIMPENKDITISECLASCRGWYVDSKKFLDESVGLYSELVYDYEIKQRIKDIDFYNELIREFVDEVKKMNKTKNINSERVKDIFALAGKYYKKTKNNRGKVVAYHKMNLASDRQIIKISTDRAASFCNDFKKVYKPNIEKLLSKKTSAHLACEKIMAVKAEYDELFDIRFSRSVKDSVILGEMYDIRDYCNKSLKKLPKKIVASTQKKLIKTEYDENKKEAINTLSQLTSLVNNEQLERSGNEVVGSELIRKLERIFRDRNYIVLEYKDINSENNIEK